MYMGILIEIWHDLKGCMQRAVCWIKRETYSRGVTVSKRTFSYSCNTD